MIIALPDLNFRNHLSNPNSELSKILAKFEHQSNYAKYFVQCFDVTNNKAKFLCQMANR